MSDKLDLKGFFGEGATAEPIEEEVVEDNDEEAAEPDIVEEDTDLESEDGEDEDIEEPEDKVDDIEQQRREFQRRADQAEHQNKLLLQQLENQKMQLMQNNQTDIAEDDDFAGSYDDDPLTIGQVKAQRKKEAQKEKAAQQAKQAEQIELQQQQLWMTSQPDFNEVDEFYRSNKASIDQMLQVNGATGIKEQYYAIKAAKKDADLDELISKTKSLSKENKKLKKKKTRVPTTGPGGVSINPGKGSGGFAIDGFFGKSWNK